MTMLKRLWLACGLIASYGIAIFLTRHIVFATETSLWWTDATGDGGPYSQDAVRAWMEGVFRSLSDDYAVLPGIRQELFPFSTGDNNITVLPGQAIVDGTWYQSDATDSITITSPGIGTTGKRIVLQKDWTAQTIRLVEISSADGTATIPTLTQSDGATWEEPICQFTITTGGVIGALTDERVFPGGVTNDVHPALAAARGRSMVIEYDAQFTVNTDTAYQGGGIHFELNSVGSLNSDAGSNHNGLARLNTTSGVNDKAHLLSGAAANIMAVTGPFQTSLPRFSTRLIPHSATSNTNNHQTFGLFDALPEDATVTQDGAYFKQEAAGNLLAVTRQDGSETTTSLGAITGFTTRDTWEIVALDSGTVIFLQNRVIVARHTGDIPTDQLGPVVGLSSDTGSGSAKDIEEIDYIWVETPRAA